MVSRTVVLAVNPDVLTDVRNILAGSATLSETVGGKERMRIHVVDAPYVPQLGTPVTPQEIARNAGLSERGFQVLQLLACGLTINETGHRLGIGPTTVRTHQKRLYRQLQVGGAAEAVAVGYRTGMLTGGES
jgi:DNA-binding NarL/FixJ family response regulator